jgi:hypothetical protein
LTRARALFLPFDNNAVVYTVGVNDRAPLTAAVCGVMREAWGAGAGFVLCFQRSTATQEEVDVDEPPAAMALDLAGVPWLVTSRAVLRRHVDRGAARWRAYYRRDPTRPPLVAIGFTSEGARVLDAEGTTVLISPHDGTVRGA